MLGFTPNWPVQPGGSELPQSRAHPRSWWGHSCSRGAGFCPAPGRMRSHWGGARGAPCSRDHQVSPGAGRAFHQWLPQPTPEHGARRAPQMAGCPCGVGHRRDPHPSPGVPTRGVTAWSSSGAAVLRRAEPSSDTHHSAFYRINLGFKGRRCPCPCPCPRPCPCPCSTQAVPSGKPWGVNPDTQRRGGTSSSVPG